ncbi:MAG: hypothetical protein Ct9H300mP25_07990 [Acidobacteriota bacterium]|nr:MAG: hypothetical protein Ct9H300mP25_07990 [Acidobacteriota bacterium]
MERGIYLAVSQLTVSMSMLATKQIIPFGDLRWRTGA